MVAHPEVGGLQRRAVLEGKLAALQADEQLTTMAPAKSAVGVFE